MRLGITSALRPLTESSVRATARDCKRKIRGIALIFRERALSLLLTLVRGGGWLGPRAFDLTQGRLSKDESKCSTSHNLSHKGRH